MPRFQGLGVVVVEDVIPGWVQGYIVGGGWRQRVVAVGTHSVGSKAVKGRYECFCMYASTPFYPMTPHPGV